jgi:hypothetical protein
MMGRSEPDRWRTGGSSKQLHELHHRHTGGPDQRSVVGYFALPLVICLGILTFTAFQCLGRNGGRGPTKTRAAGPVGPRLSIGIGALISTGKRSTLTGMPLITNASCVSLSDSVEVSIISGTIIPKYVTETSTARTPAVQPASRNKTANCTAKCCEMKSEGTCSNQALPGALCIRWSNSVDDSIPSRIRHSNCRFNVSFSFRNISVPAFKSAMIKSVTSRNLSECTLFLTSTHNSPTTPTVIRTSPIRLPTGTSRFTRILTTSEATSINSPNTTKAVHLSSHFDKESRRSSDWCLISFLFTPFGPMRYRQRRLGWPTVIIVSVGMVLWLFYAIYTLRYYAATSRCCSSASHAATRSVTSQSRSVTPAAIAGVVRRVR